MGAIRNILHNLPPLEASVSDQCYLRINPLATSELFGGRGTFGSLRQGGRVRSFSLIPRDPCVSQAVLFLPHPSCVQSSDLCVLEVTGGDKSRPCTEAACGTGARRFLLFRVSASTESPAPIRRKNPQSQNAALFLLQFCLTAASSCCFLCLFSSTCSTLASVLPIFFQDLLSAGVVGLPWGFSG